MTFKTPVELPSELTTALPILGQGLVWVRQGRGVAGVDIEIAAGGGPIVILGPNGAGKSVLLRLLTGLLTPDAGNVVWAGTVPDRARALRVGVVFQKPVLLRRCVLANLEYAIGLLGHTSQEKQTLARDALAASGLDHLADAPARALSGGEQQRLALARTLALRPCVLFLDEPTANLDPASVARIENEIRVVHARGVQIVLVTQDLNQARRLAGEVIFMYHGKVSERRAAADFFAAPKTPEAAAFLRGEILV